MRLYPDVVAVAFTHTRHDARDHDEISDQKSAPVLVHAMRALPAQIAQACTVICTTDPRGRVAMNAARLPEKSPAGTLATLSAFGLGPALGLSSFGAAAA